MTEGITIKKSKSISYVLPYVGIDIGGTLAKLCFALRKNSPVDFQHIEHLTSNQIGHVFMLLDSLNE